MAPLRSNTVVAVMVAAAAMLLMVSAAKLRTAEECTADGGVFPYWSYCWSPALYYGQEVYELTAATGSESVSGSLAPEYDESNSTYYMRLSDVGARYKLMHITSEYRFYVTQSDDVVFVNVESGRALGWRQEGDDEFWLVETDNSSDVARLQFAAAEDVSLPCPLLYPSPRCEAYNIVTYSNSSTGLSPNEEDGAIYFKKASDTVLPFLLLRSTTSVKATKSVLAARA